MLWNDPFAPLLAQLGRSPAFMPTADVMVSDSDMVLTLDLPGVKADDLSIELENGYLTVRGERRRPESHAGTWAHVERAFGSFERRIKVPDGVDANSITASMDDGVLSLIVPKPERLKPHTITIETRKEQREIETSAA